MKSFSRQAYLLLLPVTILVVIQLFGNFIGEPDPLYHYRQADLFLQNGWAAITSFPWLPFSPVGEHGANLWWGYHILIGPFAAVLDNVVGIKMAAVFFSAIFLAALSALLQAMRTGWTGLWVVLALMLSSDFLFRFSVLRPQVLVIACLVAGLWCLWQKKYWWLIIVGFIWSTIELSSIVLLASVVLYVLIWPGLRTRQRLTALGFTAAGIILGFVLHPAFPANLWLMIEQYSVLLLPLQGIDLNIGQELYPYTLDVLVRTAGLAVVIWIGCVGLMIHSWLKYKSIDRIELWLFIMTLGSFLVLFRARRFVDFWLTLAVIFCAYVLRPYIAQFRWSEFVIQWKQLWQMKVAVAIVLLIFLSVGYRNITSVVRAFDQSSPPGSYAGAATWLKEHSRAGDIVFNPQWDQFPLLFYLNQHNRYVAGMDPTFLYRYDPRLYQQWHLINQDPAEGLPVEQLYRIVKGDFGARYLFLEHSRNPNLKDYLDAASPSNFNKVYEDDEVEIYEVL